MSGERLRILHVITSLARGGAQAHLLELMRGQKARGHEVELAYFEDPEMVPDFAPVVGFPFALNMEDLASAALLGRLWGLVSAVKPDVLHTHLLKADAYGALVGRFGAARATVASKHNDESALQRPWVARLHGLLSRLDDRIIVCSDHVGRYMVQTGRAPAQKIRLVYYGIDLDRPLALSEAQAQEVRRDLDLPPAGPFLLCVARLDPQKGHPYLIEAMRGVLERFPDARLVLVGAAQQGSEEYVAALREQAAGGAGGQGRLRRGAPGRPPPDGRGGRLRPGLPVGGVRAGLRRGDGRRDAGGGDAGLGRPGGGGRTARRESWFPPATRRPWRRP